MIRWRKPSTSRIQDFSKVKKRRLDEAGADLAAPAPEADDDARDRPRCPWVHVSKLGITTRRLIAFHDSDWGPAQIADENRYLMECLAISMRPMHSNDVLFKRAAYRVATKGWNSFEAGAIPDAEIDAMAELGVNVPTIRRLIKTMVRFDAVCRDQPDGRFVTYLSGFEGPRGPRDAANNSVSTMAAEAIAADLKRRGFVGLRHPSVHRFLCLIGFINDHDWLCWKHPRHALGSTSSAPL